MVVMRKDNEKLGITLEAAWKEICKWGYIKVTLNSWEKDRWSQLWIFYTHWYPDDSDKKNALHAPHTS